MGRYYSGDIEGKFAFGVQPSTAPEDLGADATCITYCWSDKDALKNIIDGIRTRLKHRYDQIERYFGDNTGYTEQELADYLNITTTELKPILLDYYNYKLGEKAYNYMNHNNVDFCEIDAEL